MKKHLFTLGMAAVATIVAAAANPTDRVPDGYTLRWSDEFNDGSLNEKLWNIEINGNGGGNNELQYYRRENVSVGTDPVTGEGCLVLTARREKFQGKSFTSGRVNSLGKAAFKHGILQARIKFPHTGDGLWPAYWMMGNDMNKYGWPRCGELDIVETGHANGIANGTQDRYFGGTLHYGPNATAEGHQQISHDYTTPEDNPIANDDYHIITVEWDDENISMYYDIENFNAAGKRRSRYFTTNVAYNDDVMARGHYFQKPFFFLFNVAVGGSFPGIYDPAQITILPNEGDETSMYIDWVRVYQKDDDSEAQYTYVDENGNVITNIEDDPEPPSNPDDKTELSGFATKALDENGQTTFDFNDVESAVLVSTSQGVTGNLLSSGAAVYDYNVNNENRNLYIWENTYVAVNRAGETNSFGWEEGYNKFTVANVGWSGLGFNVVGEDLSMIDDTYWLHFAMRATDQADHTSHEMRVGDAYFRIGASDGSLASVGDFKRDGEWYYFDIPVKVLKQFSTIPFGQNPKNCDLNLIAFMSGGKTDAEICFDNIFFYKSKSKEIPTYKHTSADLGQYGYKSLDEEGRPVFDFSKTIDVVPLFLSGDTWESITAGGSYDPATSYVKAETDNSEQGGRNNFFVWGDPQTMSVTMVNDTENSMGRMPYGGFPAYAASSTARASGWDGAGWASIAGQGMNPQPLNLSTIDDTYYLHVSLRSDAAVGHVPVTLTFGAEKKDAKLTFGEYAPNARFADFNRDGEWYSFDIPVSVLRTFGTLWSNAPSKGGLDNYTDYSLCINTGSTYYDGSSFSIDNVFFWKGETAPEVNVLGEYTTKSLDENGESYFDFDDKDFILITTCNQVMGKMYDADSNSVIADYRPGVNGVQFYVWNADYLDPALPTYVESEMIPSTNSFGGDEPCTALEVTNLGWSGLGLISADLGCDFSQLENGDWYLHFAMCGTDDTVHSIAFGSNHFSIGATPYINHEGEQWEESYRLLGNYERNGEWYSFDIPYSEIRKCGGEVFAGADGGINAYKNNFLSISSGARQGSQLQIDNVFLWRKHPGQSGVEEIPDAEETQVERVVLGIYDLSGRSCNDMSAPGLYIVRTSLGVEKILVK